MTTNQQLELGFNGTQTPVFSRRREARVERAKWWFAKIRAAIAEAANIQEQSQPRPEQMWISGANRQLKV